jgi:hypothetical protein
VEAIITMLAMSHKTLPGGSFGKHTSALLNRPVLDILDDESDDFFSVLSNRDPILLSLIAERMLKQFFHFNCSIVVLLLLL